MRAINVKVGGVYVVKVSGKLCPVRLDRVADDVQDRNRVWKSGGWWGTNLNTGRAVRIKSAAKLRCPTPDPTPTTQIVTDVGRDKWGF